MQHRENIVNNIVMMYGDDLHCGEHQVMYRIVELLCCTPETKITLYVNYNPIIFKSLAKCNVLQTVKITINSVSIKLYLFLLYSIGFVPQISWSGQVIAVRAKTPKELKLLWSFQSSIMRGRRLQFRR